MESKHTFTGVDRIGLTLLIEPVWNRNVAGEIYSKFGTNLLIEPVWNRNATVVQS